MDAAAHGQPVSPDRRSPRPPYWIVGPTLVFDGHEHVERLVPECRNGHQVMSSQTNGDGSVYEWRGDMHLTLTCRAPHCGSIAFGVLHVRPSPLLHLYAINQAQLREYLRLPHDTPSHEVLEMLGYITRRGAA